MTVYDLLFLAAALAGVITLIVGLVTRSLRTLAKLGAGAVVYLVMVYSATLFSKPVVTHEGQPQCVDDWCLALDRVSRMGSRYDLNLRIISRARRVTQRETSARDVYLVDEQWNGYDPVHAVDDVPLSAQLVPGQSIAVHRRFELPAGVHIMGLKIHSDITPPSLCLVIGECDAFHKGKMIAIDSVQESQQ